MAEITAALVKQLRVSSGAGMMDCKKALTETAGDLEAAQDWLRKKGLAAAAKKAGRTAAEGLIGVATQDNRGAVVEVNAETDFVGRNEDFQNFVRTVAQLALESGGDLEQLKAATYPGGGTVADKLTQMVATIGENMNLRRVAVVDVGQGNVASYVHNQVAPDLGKIGVLVGVETAADTGALGRQLAMHVAAARPQAIDKDGVDASLLDRERDVLSEQARASGKPEEIIAKMVEGRLRKYYEEVCLLEQTYVIDGENKVRQVLENSSKELGSEVKVAGFECFVLGEGIEREEEDFAAEVAATLKG